MTATMTNEEIIVSTAALNQYRDTYLRVKLISTLEFIWNRRFTQTQKRKLGKTLIEARTKKGNVIQMWMAVYGVSCVRAVIEIGESAGFLTARDVDWLLDEAGEIPRDPARAREQAILRGDLVLNRTSPEIFWNGSLIEVDWAKHRSSWNFFVTACEHAKQGQAIDRLSFGNHGHENRVAKDKSRLKSLPGFPNELIKTFVNSGRGTQILSIPPDRIHFMDSVSA